MERKEHMIYVGDKVKICQGDNKREGVVVNVQISLDSLDKTGDRGIGVKSYDMTLGYIGSIDYVDSKGSSYWAYFNQIEKVEINPEFDYEYKVSKWCGTDALETDAQLQPFFEKKETNDEEWYEDMIYWS